MRCPKCRSTAVKERPERTVQGYRRFRCLDCTKQFNERSSGLLTRSAKTVTGVIPDRVTTDGHDAYPQAIRMELGSRVRHRTNCYLNNRLEQDHRGVKGRCRPMLGFKSVPSARRYCRGHDELRNSLRSRSRMCQHVPAAARRFHHMRRTATVLGILQAASTGGSTAEECRAEQARQLTEPDKAAGSRRFVDTVRPRRFRWPAV